MIPWINIELTSRCNKSCSFCGRARDRKSGKLRQGDFDINLLNGVINSVGSIIQFNKDGEPLLYEKLAEVGKICRNKVTNIVTNGILLWDRRHDLQDFTSICVSVIENDAKQFDNIIKFNSAYKKPLLYVKFLGDYYTDEFGKAGIKTLRRTIHHPSGDYNYQRNTELIPEVGVCLDFLMKPSIDWQGNVHICNRYDPDNIGIIGNINNEYLNNIWLNILRNNWLSMHLEGKRDSIPLCNGCEYWGIPRYV